jgi:hypothetical protein
VRLQIKDETCGLASFVKKANTLTKIIIFALNLRLIDLIWPIDCALGCGAIEFPGAFNRSQRRSRMKV